jgi:hypothetical protein
MPKSIMNKWHRVGISTIRWQRVFITSKTPSVLQASRIVGPIKVSTLPSSDVFFNNNTKWKCINIVCKKFDQDAGSIG